jgi:hypothetical protein
VLANQALKAVELASNRSSPWRRALPGALTWSRPGWRTLVTDQKPCRAQGNSATHTALHCYRRGLWRLHWHGNVFANRGNAGGWGLRTVQVELSEQVIDFLLARKYELERSDNASVGLAVSAFVSDAVLEWA